MTFRMYETTHRYNLISMGVFGVLLIIAALVQLPYSETDGHNIVMLLACFVMYCAGYYLWRTPKITMDNQGIRCFNRKSTLWYLRWDEVKEIVPIILQKHRGIELVPVQPLSYDPSLPRWPIEYKLQYGAKAKAAFARFCPIPVGKR